MIVRTSEQVLGAALDRLVRETDVSVTTPGSVARTFFEIISEEMAYNYRIMDANLGQLFVSTAGGDALDKLGTLFGVTRRSSNAAIDANEGRVYFYLNSSPTHVPGTSDIVNSGTEVIVIPEGTLISTDPIGPGMNPTTFRTTADAYIDVNAYMTFVSVEPAETITNTIGEGTVVHHDLGLDGVYVYNRADLEVFEEIESDNNYRFRIVSAINLAAKANTLALRVAALGTDGVRNCKVSPLAHGVGTVKVVVVLEDPGAASSVDAFANASAAAKAAAAAGDIVTCVRPAETLVGITAIIVGDGITDRIRELAKRAVIRYISSLDVGDTLSTSKLIAEAISVAPQIRDFAIIDSGYTLNGLPSVFTRTEAKEDEQFYATADSIAIL